MITTKEFMQIVFGNTFAYLTQEYGETDYSYKYRANFHTGIDVANYMQPAYIYCAVAGVVVEDLDWNLTQNYGRAVTIESIGNDGKIYRMRYGHFKENYVSLGQFVPKKYKLGLQGTTGFSTGPHLHNELFKGRENPYSFPNDAEFISRWIDPRKIDEIFGDEISPPNLDNLDLTEMEKKEFQEQIAKILMIGGTPADYVKAGFTKQEDLDKWSNSPEKQGTLGEIYNAIFRREKDSGGSEFWKDKDLMNIIRGFVNSQEFKLMQVQKPLVIKK